MRRVFFCCECVRLIMPIRPQQTGVLEAMTVSDSVAVNELDGDVPSPPFGKDTFVASISDHTSLGQGAFDGEAAP
jgi:hypothetical protein